jgi:hypothetical protein
MGLTDISYSYNHHLNLVFYREYAESLLIIPLVITTTTCGEKKTRGRPEKVKD